MTNKQIPLGLEHEPSYALADFLVAPSNEQAFEIIDSWPDWSHHAMCITGPEGSGKSHLGHSWSQMVGAYHLRKADKAVDVQEYENILIEDADVVAYDQETLFHLFNWAKENKHYLLFTGRLAPTQWEVNLPDLKSRLATIPVRSILPPDDQLLFAILIKLFSDRQLQVDLSIVDYLLRRIERYFAGAKSVVHGLDELALSKKARITKPLAREVLQQLGM